MQSALLTWSAHQFWQPARWVDLPIFHPARGALTYMDSLLGQALLVCAGGGPDGRRPRHPLQPGRARHAGAGRRRGRGPLARRRPGRREHCRRRFLRAPVARLAVHGLAARAPEPDLAALGGDAGRRPVWFGWYRFADGRRATVFWWLAARLPGRAGRLGLVRVRGRGVRRSAWRRWPACGVSRGAARRGGWFAASSCRLWSRRRVSCCSPGPTCASTTSGRSTCAPSTRCASSARTRAICSTSARTAPLSVIGWAAGNRRARERCGTSSRRCTLAG